MKKLCALLFIICCGFTSLNASYEITKDEMLNYVDSVHALIQSRYAPAEWKQGYCQWNLAKEINKLKQTLNDEENLTVKSFQRQLRHFLYSMKDYHVNVCFFSTEASFLPFKAKKFGDRYFITYVDKEKFSVFNEGDELVSFGGEDPEAVVGRLKHSSTPSAASESDQSLAEIWLTLRGAVIGHEVPNGPITVTARDRNSGELKSYQMIWTYRPEKVNDHLISKPQSPVLPGCLDVEKMNRHRALPLAEYYSSAFSGQNDDSCTLDPNEMGAKRSFLPKLGSVEWETPDTALIHAYIYQNDDDKTVGYLRIPHFQLSPEEMEELAQIIPIMQETADVLVIDQLNNPGGNLFTAYAIASMLTDVPLETPKEHLLLSQDDVLDAWFLLDTLNHVQSDDDAKSILGDSFFGIPANYQIAQFMKEYARFIIEQWKEGKIYSDLTYMYGIDHINPHPEIRFKKPIVLLINGLDFSCGDFFPAILKDNNRATLVGSRTAGAGGFVMPHFIANRMGVYCITLTGSLGIRSNGDPIENLGVGPHVVNELTPADIQNNYQDYIRTINEVVKEKGNL